MIQILHYYCKPRRADVLNNIAYNCGISCQIQTDYLDISDIVKELNNKNHIDCIAIDEDMFGAMADSEDIITKLEVLKFVCEDTQILIIAPDRFPDDEIIKAISKSGLADCIITKDMSEQFEDIVTQYFDGKLNDTYSKTSQEKQGDISASDNITDNNTVKNIDEAEIEKILTEDIQEENIETSSQNSRKRIKKSSLKPEKLINVIKGKDNAADNITEEISLKAPEDNFTADKMITVGICGLQPHIGVTHHALAMAKALTYRYKNVCYKECNKHDAYRVLRTSSLAVEKQGYINIMGVSVFDKNEHIDIDKYDVCIMDFGYIHECREDAFFDTDVQVIVAGVKDWEIQNFVGAYQSGMLDRVNVLINFFPEKEQDNFRNAFSELNMCFANYAPEVFEPENNAEIYNEIINTYWREQ